jgi:hypothetical protein
MQSVAILHEHCKEDLGLDLMKGENLKNNKKRNSFICNLFMILKQNV